MSFRPKFFVVMGFDNQGNIYGGVVFDSEINRNYVNPDFEDFFLPIPCSKYTFLDHDSYIDCRKMKPSTLETLLEGDCMKGLKKYFLTRILKRNIYLNKSPML